MLTIISHKTSLVLRKQAQKSSDDLLRLLESKGYTRHRRPSRQDVWNAVGELKRDQPDMYGQYQDASWSSIVENVYQYFRTAWSVPYGMETKPYPGPVTKIDKDNWQEYSPENDDVDAQWEQQVEPTDEPRETPIAIDQKEDTSGVIPEFKEIPYYTAEELIEDAERERELIGFYYTTIEGTPVGYRIVEPHYTFVAATTGNHILVSYDRVVDDIRAFVIGPSMYGGVRYSGAKFQPKPQITAGD